MPHPTPLPSLPSFSALPPDIRRDIFHLAAATAFTHHQPTVHTLLMQRRWISSVPESALITASNAAVASRAAAEFPHLSPAEIEAWQREEALKVVRAHRATEVFVDGAEESTWSDEFWRAGELAAVCGEAAEGVQRVVKALDKRADEGREKAEVLARVAKGSDVVCIVGPEEQAMAELPFFGRSLVEGGRQVVVSGTMGLGPRPVWTVQERSAAAAYCPTLLEVCPEMEGVEKVAFVYRPKPEDSLGKLSFSRRLGLHELWPRNLPSVNTIYLIDPKIKPKAGSGEWTPPYAGFANHWGPLYTVCPKDTELWDIKLPNGNLLPVFEEAANLQSEYTPRIWGRPIVRVKVLAVVNHRDKDDKDAN